MCFLTIFVAFFTALGWSQQTILSLDRDDLNELLPSDGLLLVRKSIMKIITKFNENKKVSKIVLFFGSKYAYSMLICESI